MRRPVVFAALVAALVGVALGSEFTSPNIVHLTSADYEEKVRGICYVHTQLELGSLVLSLLLSCFLPCVLGVWSLDR